MSGAAPAPTPKTKRPPLTIWTDAALSAVTPSWRLAMLTTRLPRLMRVVLAAPGVAALVVLLRGRAAGRSLPPRGRGWVVWPVLLVFGCLFELANFLAQPDGTTPNHAHPVLSDIVEPWLASGPARAVFCGAWLVVGWRLLHALVAATQDDVT